MDWQTVLTSGRPLPKGRTLWQLIGLVAAAQSLVLGYMVWERAHLLRTGREVTLDVVPVDPRSLFRGDYVRLGYDFSRVTAANSEAKPGAVVAPAGTPVYVTLRRDADGKWKAAAVSETALPRGDAPDEIVLKGRRETPGWTGPNAIRYGIERFYVPEGEGLQLEKDARDKRLSVIVAVDKAGNAAIKQLLVDGKVAATVPLL